MDDATNKLKEDSIITMRMGRTTFKIRICFDKKSKETLDDRVKKLIRREVSKYFIISLS